MMTRVSGVDLDSVDNRHDVMRRVECDLGAFKQLVKQLSSCYSADANLSQADPAVDRDARIAVQLRDAADRFSSDTAFRRVAELESGLRSLSDEESMDLLSRIEQNLDAVQAALDEAFEGDC